MTDDVVLVPVYDKLDVIGSYTTVDAADGELVRSHTWRSEIHPHKSRTTYVYFAARSDGKVRRFYLHRLLMGLQHGDGLTVDHIDRNGLNNRRDNLRVGTHALNAQNLDLNKRNKSGYRGVSYHTSLGKWVAKAKLDYKWHWIGTFASADEAGTAAAEWRLRHMPFAREDNAGVAATRTVLKRGNTA